MADANSERNQGHRWQPGESGNPAGKPKGTRHRATMAVEALLDGEADALTRKAVELALAGDTVARRLCLERICPPRKDVPAAFDLPEINSLADAGQVMGAVLRGVAQGAITPTEAQGIAAVVEIWRRTMEIAEIEARIAALEQETPRR